MLYSLTCTFPREGLCPTTPSTNGLSPRAVFHSPDALICRVLHASLSQTLAKPLAAGLPIGAVLMTEEVASCILPGDHGSTFAGNPLVTRAALTVMDRLEAPEFLPNVNARGEQLMGQLRERLAGNDKVREVRGMGLLVGVQLTQPAGAVVAVSDTWRLERLQPNREVSERRVSDPRLHEMLA